MILKTEVQKITNTVDFNLNVSVLGVSAHLKPTSQKSVYRPGNLIITLLPIKLCP